jgi:hypothetical protein
VVLVEEEALVALVELELLIKVLTVETVAKTELVVLEALVALEEALHTLVQVGLVLD